MPRLSTPRITRPHPLSPQNVPQLLRICSQQVIRMQKQSGCSSSQIRLDLQLSDVVRTQ